MKIIVFADIADRTEMVLSADSAMLVGGKPYFLPDDMGAIDAYECRLLRISRLGKHIAARFADRYYDAVANGIHFVPTALRDQAIREGHSWTNTMAYDMSLCIGDWQEAKGEEANELIIRPEEAIEQASRCMTIRQGDLIAIYTRQQPVPVQQEQIIERTGLYCKIK